MDEILCGVNYVPLPSSGCPIQDNSMSGITSLRNHVPTTNVQSFPPNSWVTLDPFFNRFTELYGDQYGQIVIPPTILTTGHSSNLNSQMMELPFSNDSKHHPIQTKTKTIVRNTGRSRSSISAPSPLDPLESIDQTMVDNLVNYIGSDKSWFTKREYLYGFGIFYCDDYSETVIHVDTKKLYIFLDYVLKIKYDSFIRTMKNNGYYIDKNGSNTVNDIVFKFNNNCKVIGRKPPPILKKRREAVRKRRLNVVYKDGDSKTNQEHKRIARADRMHMRQKNKNQWEVWPKNAFE